HPAVVDARRGDVEGVDALPEKHAKLRQLIAANDDVIHGAPPPRTGLSRRTNLPGSCTGRQPHLGRLPRSQAADRAGLAFAGARLAVPVALGVGAVAPGGQVAAWIAAQRRPVPATPYRDIADDVLLAIDPRRRAGVRAIGAVVDEQRGGSIVPAL